MLVNILKKNHFLHILLSKKKSDHLIVSIPNSCLLDKDH